MLAIKNIIDDNLIDATANQVIETLLENLENTVENYVKSVKIPASLLFNGECSIDEMNQILMTAETKLTNDVTLTLRDLFDDMKISDN